MYSSKNTQSSWFSRLRRPIPIICIGVVILIAIVAVLEFSNTTHIFHKTPLKKTAVIKTTSSNSTKKTDSGKSKTVAAKSSSATPAASNSSDGAKSTVTNGNSSVTLVEPSGNFVSNHTVKLGEGENSVCNTTPGATCTITFTMGGITRSLGTQTTDSNGSTSWDWTVNSSSSGFSEGKWTIKVTASLNGQTKTVTDNTPLEIGS